MSLLVSFEFLRNHLHFKQFLPEFPDFPQFGAR